MTDIHIDLSPSKLSTSLNSTSKNDNQEKVIKSICTSLADFLNKLPDLKVIEVSPTIQLKSNDSSSTSHHTKYALSEEADKLDGLIIGLLSYAGSQFSVWIFGDFSNSLPLQNFLWISVFYVVIKRYSSHISGSHSKEEVSQFPPEALKILNDRFKKICKHINYFYKQLITRIIEQYGSTPHALYVASILRLSPESPRFDVQAKRTYIPTIHESIYNSLCHMGDMSRYRYSFDKDYDVDSAEDDYSHALIYYSTASRISPNSGTPLNQLGNLAYSRGDFFSATYEFLRSISVDEYFKDGLSNLKVILRKLYKMDPAIAAERPISGFSDSSSESNRQAKQTLIAILQMYSHYLLAIIPSKSSNSSSQPSFDPFASHALQRSLTRKLKKCVESDMIPSRILSRLVVIAILFCYLLNKISKENSQGDGRKGRSKLSSAALSPRDGYKLTMSLTIRIFDKLLSVSIQSSSNSNNSTASSKSDANAEGGSGNNLDNRDTSSQHSIADTDQDTNSRAENMSSSKFDFHDELFPEENDESSDEQSSNSENDNTSSVKILSKTVLSLLPCYRIIFDWTNKQLAENEIHHWGQGPAHTNLFLRKIWKFLEMVRKLDGFEFDVATAVARSNADRYEELLNENIKSNLPQQKFETSSADVELLVIKQQMNELFDQVHCLGLLPLNGGLSDTPSGLAVNTSWRSKELNEYRIQCLLFSGVEMSRHPITFLKLEDDFDNNKAHFVFEELEFDDIESDEEPAAFSDTFAHESLKEEMRSSMYPAHGNIQNQKIQLGNIPKAPASLRQKNHEPKKPHIRDQDIFKTDSNYDKEEEQVVDELEYFSIKRNDDYFKRTADSSLKIKSVSNNSSNGAPAEEFPKVDTIASAEPSFLLKLIDLENAEHKSKGRRNKGSNGRSTKSNDSQQPNIPGGPRPDTKGEQPRRRRRRRGRRRKKAGKTDGNESQIEGKSTKQNDMDNLANDFGRGISKYGGNSDDNFNRNGSASTSVSGLKSSNKGQLAKSKEGHHRLKNHRQDRDNSDGHEDDDDEEEDDGDNDDDNDDDTDDDDDEEIVFTGRR